MEIKRATPGKLEVLGHLADRVFRPQQKPGTGMVREFPHLFDPHNASNLFYVEHRGMPVSMVGVLKQVGIFPGGSLPIASVGSVATLAEYRGKRIASSILRTAFQAMKDEGQALSIISGTRALYQLQGARPVGQMETVLLTHTVSDGFHHGFSWEWVASTRRISYASKLVSIYREEPYRFARTGPHMALLLNAMWFQRQGYHQELFLIRDMSGVVGYVVAYTTDTQPDRACVMEWAGNRQGIVSALPEIMGSLGAKSMVFSVHEEDRWMKSLVRSRSWVTKSCPLFGTVKVLNIEVLMDAYGSWRAEHLGDWPDLASSKSTETAAKLFDRKTGLGLPLMLTNDLNYI